MPAANTTYTATWTEAVASVTVSGVTTYYATLDAAWTAANSATAASTIKLLKAATVTTQLTYDNENDQNCTLDLNGFTLTSTTDVQSPLTIDNADITFTITDGTVGKAGKLSMTTTYSSGDIYSVLINSGALVLDGGTMEVTANRQTNGIWVKTGASFTLSDGTLHVKTTNSKKGRGVFIDGGMATIDGGEIFMETADNGTAIYYNAGTGAVTVTGGKFKIITDATEFVTYDANKNRNITISGGYYNYSNERLTKYLATSYHVFNVDPALDGIYTYEVAEGYTLTWSTDGDPLTGTYTSGTTKVGTTIVAPNTPTKTGYTFAGWSTTPAATMPASDVTYTATWTINSFDVTFNMQGHGTAIAKQTIDYNGLVTEPATPTEENYVFGGWYKEDGCTNAWNFASDHVTGTTTLYAKWTEAVASVHVGAGAKSYFTTLAGAFDDAKTKDNAVITILKDITDQTALTYDVAKTCTLDLHNHLVQGAAEKLLEINKSGSTFVITDKSDDKGGELYNEVSGENTYYGVYLTAGTFKLLAGKVHAKNTKDDYASATTAAKKCMARGVHVESSQTFQMSGGEVEGEAIYAGYGVETAGTTTISGGTIHGKTNKFTNAVGVHSSGSTTITAGTIKATAYTTTSYGLYVNGNTTSINSGDSVIIESKTTTDKTAYGIHVKSGTFNANTGCKLRVSVEAKKSASYGVSVAGGKTANIYAGKFIVKSTTGTAFGIYSSGTTSIYGGKFNVSTGSNTKAYGIYALRGTVTINNNPTFDVTSGTTTAYGAYAYGTIGAKGIASTKFSGTIEINGGTFNVTSTTTTAYGAYAGLAPLNLPQKTEVAGDTIFGQHYMPGIIRITNGTFNVTATTNTAYGVVVAAAKSESGFEGATKKIPTLAITGGKFKVSTGDATKAYAVNTSASNTALDIQGGYYNINTNLSDYVAPTKSCNYYCLSTTAADKAEVGSDYEYKVAEAYTLTWNLDGGTVTTAGTGAAVDATGTPSIAWGVGDAIIAPTVTKPGYTFAAWTPAVAATMPSANTTYTATWTPVALLTFVNPGVWSDPSNWEPACVPTSAHDVYIQKPCSVDIEHAAAKSIVIRNGYSSYTGKLTVGPNMGLDVAGTITKTTNGSNSLATNESDLVLESSTAGNASLIFNNSNGDAATVQMYSKATVVDNTWNWQYVGTPFTGSIPLYNYYGSWMYKWYNDGESNGWSVVHGSDVLDPFVGYCLTQANPTTHIMSGTLVATDTKDQTITMGASTDKVLANSWTAPISICSFTESTFTSTPATIYLFNTGSAENGSSEGDAAGTFIAVPINSAVYTGNGLIAPMQGFFVTTNGVGGEAGKITLKYNELVRPAGSHTDIVAGPMKSPMRDREDFGEPDVLKISAKGSIYKDRVVILAREDFSEGFDNGWDGEKKGYNSIAPAVFVINEEGKNDAVSAIPEYEGTLVGFRAGTDNEYTLTFEYNGDEVLYLNDLKAQMSTVIANGQTYTFTTEDGDSEVRFIISHTPIHKITTGIDEVVGGTKVRKIIINDKVYIIRNGRLYNVTGALVK